MEYPLHQNHLIPLSLEVGIGRGWKMLCGLDTSRRYRCISGETMESILPVAVEEGRRVRQCDIAKPLVGMLHGSYHVTATVTALKDKRPPQYNKEAIRCASLHQHNRTDVFRPDDQLSGQSFLPGFVHYSHAVGSS